MILAISRFRIANGIEEQVKEAFFNRPHLVDGVPAFLGMETFTDSADPTVFYLVTRWTDAESFHGWHRSEMNDCFLDDIVNEMPNRFTAGIEARLIASRTNLFPKASSSTANISKFLSSTGLINPTGCPNSSRLFLIRHC